MATYTSPAQGRITDTWMNKRTHLGTDIAPPTPGQTGRPVCAWSSGTVAKTGNAILSGRTGNGVLINHDDGTRSYYGHLASIGVKTGQRVSTGQQVGVMGKTGKVTGIHLHFEIHVNGKAVNPQPFARDRGVTLGAAVSGGGSPAPAPAPSSGWVINTGDVAQVKRLQEKLNNWKAVQRLGRLLVDGQYGPKTQAAVLAVQKANPSIFGVADGVVGPKTAAALGL